MQANARGIPPLADQAVDTEMVRTRMAMMVPHPYVALVLQKNRTPVEFWTDIIGQILRDGKQEECKPLIDWGRVALMNDENGDCLVSFNNLSVPLMDNELAKHRHTILANVLPTIGRSVGMSSAPQMTAIVDAIGAMHSTQRESHMVNLHARAEATAPKRPGNRWKVSMLLRVCEVQTEADLPDIWSQLANSDKKSDRFVLNAAFQQQAKREMVEAPLATSRLTTIIVGLNWGSIDVNDLSEGLQPFLTASVEPATAAKMNAIGLQHDAVLAGAATSLKGIIDLFSMEKIHFPVQFFQAMASLQQFNVVLKVLLGENHRIVGALDGFIRNLNTKRTNLEYHCLEAPLFPSALIRAVQLRMVIFFNSISEGALVPVPDLQTTIVQIETQEWNPPQIPPVYLKDIKESLARAGKLTGFGYQYTPGVEKMPDGHKTPADTEFIRPVPTTGHNNTPIINNNPYADIASVVGTKKNALKIKETIKAHPAPVREDGEDFCLSWHGKQQCFPGCGRKDDHHSNHSPTDKSKLLAYFKQYFQ
jgi:hypothetical protein